MDRGIKMMDWLRRESGMHWLAQRLRGLFSHAIVLGCLLNVGRTRCEAQNLVPNGSFESYENCPATFGFAAGKQTTELGYMAE